MASPPELPAANAELRRLFAAGRPPDGSNLALMRALVAADFVVPLHPAGGLLRMARKHPRRDGDEVVLNAFTSHELAARWSAGIRDAPPEKMAVGRATALVRQAMEMRVDVVEIDRGSAGYSMGFRDMMDLLTRTAFDGKELRTFEAVSIGYGTPKTMPPARMLEEIATIGRAHRLTQLFWSMAWIGEALPEMQLVLSPHPSVAFTKEVVERMNDLTRDRFTASTHDASSHRLPMEHLHRLI